MTKQIKSRQRVADHGEVFTAEREVEAMCDLVKQETERIDSRFLEPACGDGNFLSVVLKRKLAIVTKKYRRSAYDWERNSLLALGSLYGVDILLDNVIACQKRLYEIWSKEYKAVCKNECNDETRQSAQFILRLNIVCGNALTLMCVDAEGCELSVPIIFLSGRFRLMMRGCNERTTLLPSCSWHLTPQKPSKKQGKRICLPMRTARWNPPS